jgi:hypothetical protein
MSHTNWDAILEETFDEMEKDALLEGSLGRVAPGRIWSGVKGFFGGQRAAHAEQAAANALHRLQDNPMAAESLGKLQGQMPRVAPTSGIGGIFERIGGQIRGGVAGAGQGLQQHDYKRDMDILRQNAPHLFEHEQPGFLQKHWGKMLLGGGLLAGGGLMAANALKDRQPDYPQYPQYPQAAPPQQGHYVTAGFKAKALGLTGVGLTGLATYRGAKDSAESSTRATDYAENMKHDLGTPMPSLEVTASYEKFAEEKLAAPPSQPMYLMPSAQSAFAQSFGGALAQKLVTDPLDALQSKLKKTWVDEPKWKRNFNDVVTGDPTLSQLHQERPQVLSDAYESIKRFSPTVAKDRLATRNILRHVAMSGGEMDHATMRMLAETEKFHNDASRKGR